MTRMLAAHIEALRPEKWEELRAKVGIPSVINTGSRVADCVGVTFGEFGGKVPGFWPKLNEAVSDLIPDSHYDPSEKWTEAEAFSFLHDCAYKEFLATYGGKFEVDPTRRYEEFRKSLPPKDHWSFYQTLTEVSARPIIKMELRKTEVPETETDEINPSHYKGDLVARIIEKFELGFNLGNVCKYILREKNKAGIVDLKKAIWYIQREIAARENKLPPLE